MYPVLLNQFSSFATNNCNVAACNEFNTVVIILGFLWDLLTKSQI